MLDRGAEKRWANPGALEIEIQAAAHLGFFFWKRILRFLALINIGDLDTDLALVEQKLY